MTAVRLRNVNRPATPGAIISYYYGGCQPVSGCHPDPDIHREKRKSAEKQERGRLGQNREKNAARE